MNPLRVLVTGINGQMGAYMAAYLLGFQFIRVYGLSRKSSLKNIQDIRYNSNFILVDGDISDKSFITEIVCREKFDYIFNFAAISNIAECEDNIHSAFSTNVEGVSNLLDAIYKYSKPTVLTNAGTTKEVNCNTFYGRTKIMARQLIEAYQDRNVACWQPFISLNDSEKRLSADFVSRKIVNFIKEYKLAAQNDTLVQLKPLKLLNIDVVKYWGHTENFIPPIYEGAVSCKTATLKILKNFHNKFAVFGESRSVRDFLEVALSTAAIQFKRQGDCTYLLPHNAGHEPLIYCDPTASAESDTNINKSEFICAYPSKPLVSFKDMIQRMLE